MSDSTNITSILGPAPAIPLPRPQTANSTTIVIQMSPEDPGIQPKLDVLNWSLTILAGMVVGLRIYNKYRGRFQLWWDDYIAISSWVVLAADAIVTTVQVHSGTGKHAAGLDPLTIREFALTAHISATLSIIVTASSKTGFAVTLLKIAEGWPRRLVWISIYVVNIVSGIAGTLFWVECTPLRKNFENIPYGYCWSPQVIVALPIVNTSVSGTMDIMLSFVALYIVHKKTMNQGYWFGALFCTVLGIFAGITSFAKAALMHILVGNDVTFDIVFLLVWGMTEPAVIIIAGSLPELRNLIWNYPKPTRAYSRVFTRRRNGIHFGEDYAYAKRQYLSGKGKTMSFSTDSQTSNI